jgi:hypothetical protein
MSRKANEHPGEMGLSNPVIRCKLPIGSDGSSLSCAGRLSSWLRTEPPAAAHSGKHIVCSGTKVVRVYALFAKLQPGIRYNFCAAGRQALIAL